MHIRMKPILLLVIVTVSAATGAPSEAGKTGENLPPLPPGKEWKLVWSDEFGGKNLDKSKWEIFGENGDRRRRDGFWVEEDAYLDGKGNLVLRTKKDGDRFTCGGVRSRGKFEHKFGYWVARCKYPTQEGHWPAFWLHTRSVNRVGNEGRDGTEIDIMEKPWREDRITQNLHWDGYGRSHKHAGTTVDVPGVSKGFHTFGLHWKPDEYVFDVNGKVTWRTSAGGVSQVPQYAKLTEEIGKWGGDIEKAKLPDYFYVDYVRVYDVVDAATHGKGGAVPGSSSKPVLKKTNLFEAGTGGYAHYRIPGIVVTTQGALLAYCEARKSLRGDWGTIDIMMRRSTDGGASWSPPKKIVTVKGEVKQNPVALKQNLAKPGEITINNPVAIVDRKTGAVHFLYCVEYARCYYMRSDDDGRTFTEPVDITPTFDRFRRDYDWKVLATGPGHGVQLQNGRLLVPVWLSTGTGGHAHRPSCISVVYSDDRGVTWKRGEIVCGNPDPKNPSETVAVQLADGRVMLNIRNESPKRRRGVSIGPDGATRWSPFRFDEQLPEPICMGSIVRLSKQPEYRKNRILFANPHNSENRERKNVSVKMSYDEGRSWPVMKSIEPGVSGYSDLAVGPDGSVYCFYERDTLSGSHYNPKYLCVAQFNLAWLTDGEDRLEKR